MKQVSQSFFKGSHQAVVDSLQKKSRLSKDEIPWLIGALTFLGKMEEAEELFKKNKGLASESLASCRFYLGIGWCRLSHYAKGKSYLTKNLSEFDKSKNNHIQFYINQGIGFFHYLECDYKKAKSYAELAVSSSSKEKFIYGKMLAEELSGYSNIQLGNISFGLEKLRASSKLAHQLGHGSWESAITTSVLCFEGQFGLKPQTIIKELETLFKKTPQENTFSRSSILLELARQYTLRGKIGKSDEVLNEACRLIYSLRHKRHGALLNLRYAENRYISGNSFEALNLMRLNRSELNPEIDTQLLISTLGMEKKLCATLSIPFDEKQEQHLTELIQSKGTSRDQKTNHPIGEDPIGTLLDKVLIEKEASFRVIQESGYFGLLHRILPKQKSKFSIYLEPTTNFLIIRSPEELFITPHSVSEQVLQLLSFISNSLRTKKEIVEKIWGYEYHPLRHDPMLYRLVARLRESLGSLNSALQSMELGYQLSTEVEFVVLGTKTKQTVQVQQEISSIQLNFRQLEILKLLEKMPFISQIDAKKIFKTSPMTAYRDLAELHQDGYLIRSGKGRATRYSLPHCSTISPMLTLTKEENS